MTCDCPQQLLDEARRLLVAADRARRERRTARNADHLATRANGYAQAAGHLRQGDRPVTDQLTTVEPEIDRDRYGRPLVTPPGGGKPVPYTRCTTYVGCLEDTYNLARWQQRMVALGLADRPDLLLAVAAHRDDKRKLNDLCADALEAAKGSAAATTGTAVHALTEIVDRGLNLPVIPDGAAADLDAYRAATAGFEHLGIETFTVLDDLQIGGTPDRIVRLPDGRVVIADLKTGDIEFGIGKIAMQLAVYSRAVRYDHRTRERRPLVDGGTVDQDRALVMHLPAGQGECNLVWVDIAAGWEAVQLATQVRAWRARKNLTEPFTSTYHAPDPGPDLLGLIGLAADVDSLTALWSAHQDEWTDAHTAAAAARKASLTAPAA